jgi:hypothetical protein
LLVSPNLHFLIKPFVPRHIFESLQVIPARGALPKGFYMLHPWKDTRSTRARWTEIKSFETVVVVALDHRKVPLFWSRPLRAQDHAVVHLHM